MNDLAARADHKGQGCFEFPDSSHLPEAFHQAWKTQTKYYRSSLGEQPSPGSVTHHYVITASSTDKLEPPKSSPRTVKKFVGLGL